MLRITCHENSSKVLLKLEGRLGGPWVEELRQRVLQLRPMQTALEVDITDLSFADDEGEQALLWLFKWALSFEAAVFMAAICAKTWGSTWRHRRSTAPETPRTQPD
jgi:hypothetical protein